MFTPALQQTASQNKEHKKFDQWDQNNPKNSIPNGRAHQYLIFLSKRGVCFIMFFFQLQKNLKEKAASVQIIFF